MEQNLDNNTFTLENLNKSINKINKLTEKKFSNTNLAEEEIEKDEWSDRIQWYLAEWHKTTQKPIEEPKLPEEKPVTEEKKELPQTTLLLEEPKESPFKMLLFLAFVCLFGYFIIKMDNIYYKISFIISFMIFCYIINNIKYKIIKCLIFIIKSCFFIT